MIRLGDIPPGLTLPAEMPLEEFRSLLRMPPPLQGAAGRAILAELRREHDEQAALVEAVAVLIPRYPLLALLHAIPNGELREPQVAVRLQAEGVKAGVPDLCLPVRKADPAAPGGFWSGLYIEMKTLIGQVQPAQRWWHAHLAAQGFKVVVCRSVEAAWQALAAYLEIPVGEVVLS